MGILNRKKEKKANEKIKEYFQLLNAYSPVFTTYEGSIFEMELTRAAIHSFALNVSKLKPHINGNAKKTLEKKMQIRPNPLMNTSQYLYRLAVGYITDNTVFICPLYDEMGKLEGFYPMLASKSKIVNNNGEKYLQYNLTDNNSMFVKFSDLGILRQMQYKHEIFGSNNNALKPTMDLIHMQNQGIIEGVKNSANIRFIAKLAFDLDENDLKEERKRLMRDNLDVSNNGGFMLIDQKYEDVKQIDSKQYIVNPNQMQQIKENVFNYFGTNEKIIQNKATPSEMLSFYEGKIEPFAIEMSLEHTCLAFTEKEMAFGNEIMFSANRLQYMDPKEKLEYVTTLFDRGQMTQNEGREILNMPGIGSEGDKFYIRGEYILKDTNENENKEGDNNANKK